MRRPASGSGTSACPGKIAPEMIEEITAIARTHSEAMVPGEPQMKRATKR